MTTDNFEYDSSEYTSKPKPTMQEVLASLEVYSEGQIPASVYYGLSNIASEDVTEFKLHWDQYASDLKQKLLTELTEASEVNFELDYQLIGYLGLTDSESQIRKLAIQLLWSDESISLLEKLMEIAAEDDNNEVRAVAVSELGRFILLGEYDKIPQRIVSQAHDVVIGLLEDTLEDVEVRRRALEAISNSSLEIVPDTIREAYESDERLMRVSSIFAMGRSYDNQWNEIVLREIRSDDSEIRYEAVRAAGELEIQEAVSLLGQLAVVDEREIREVAIWSLGEIGGNQAIKLLSALAEDAQEAQDEDLMEVVEDAIGFANLSGNSLDFRFDD